MSFQLRWVLKKDLCSLEYRLTARISFNINITASVLRLCFLQLVYPRNLTPAAVQFRLIYEGEYSAP
jgi:hypothetical protein